MIVRAIDGRFLGHRFFSPSNKNGLGIGCRQRLNSYNKTSLYMYIYIYMYMIYKYSTGRKWSRPVPALSGALCVGAVFYVVVRRSVAALCVGARHSLCRAPALFVSRSGALSPLSVSGPGATPPQISSCSSACQRAPYSDPRLTHLVCGLRSSESACCPFGSDPRATHPDFVSAAGPRAHSRAGPAGPQLRSACHRSAPRAAQKSARHPPTHPAQWPHKERTPNLTVWGWKRGS